MWARPLDPSIGVAGAKKSQVQKQQARVARSVAPKAMSSVLMCVHRGAIKGMGREGSKGEPKTKQCMKRWET